MVNQLQIVLAGAGDGVAEADQVTGGETGPGAEDALLLPEAGRCPLPRAVMTASQSIQAIGCRR